MRHGAFDDIVSRYLAGRSERSVLLAAGLPLKALTNMRNADRLPPADRFHAVSDALDAPESELLDAWLRDAGYRLPDREPHDELALTVMTLPAEVRPIAQSLLQALRNQHVHRR